jgi:hypothetical protein
MCLLALVSKKVSVEILPITHYPLPITHYQLPITHYQLPSPHYPLPIPHYPLPINLIQPKFLPNLEFAELVLLLLLHNKAVKLVQYR